MDPALLREKAAFKKRALAVPVVEKKKTEKKEAVKEKPKKTHKKKKSKLSRPKPQPLFGE